MTPEPFFDWLSVINLLGVVQGLFLAMIFFIMNKGNRAANRWLGATLLVLAFLVFEIFLGYTGYIRYLPFLVNVEEPVVFLIAPLTYFYIRTLLKPDFTFRWKQHFIHFVPFFVQLMGRVPFYLQSNAYKLQDTAWSFHQPTGEGIPARKISYYPEINFFTGAQLDLVFFILVLAYHAYNIWFIFLHLKNRDQSVWHVSDVSLRLLLWVFASLSVFLLVVVFFTFALEDDLGDIYIASCGSLIFYSISYYLISHLQAAGPEKHATRNTTKKYEKSVLDPAMTEGIMQKLEQCIRTQKPYLNSELTMPQLAEQLHASPHHLSQVINEQYGLNFPDFINQYRIEEMKVKLRDPQYHHYKIEQIAFDTGFNAKSTFQAAFKKFTGLTPSQFRKKAKKTDLPSS